MCGRPEVFDGGQLCADCAWMAGDELEAVRLKLVTREEARRLLGLRARRPRASAYTAERAGAAGSRAVEVA
jgi:hypothetical protein